LTEQLSKSFNPKAHHFFIGGITGSGKTTFGSSIFEKVDTLAIFINTSEERIPEQKSQIVVTSVDDLCKAIEMDARKICFNPREAGDVSVSDVEEISRIMLKMGRQIHKKRRFIAVFGHLFIDEVHEFSELHRANKTIDRIWKRGRRYGIIGVAMSQRPADVSHTILTQCRYHVIFRLGTYEIPYFARYKIPIEDHEEWLKKDYHFCIFDGEEVKRFYPIKI